jgi:hypothetical protein
LVAILFQRIIYGKTKHKAYKMLYFNKQRILTTAHLLAVYRIRIRCFRNCFIQAGYMFRKKCKPDDHYLYLYTEAPEKEGIEATRHRVIEPALVFLITFMPFCLAAFL